MGRIYSACLSDRNSYRYESTRLFSFNKYVSILSETEKTVAKQGFRYLSDSYTIKCFSCSTRFPWPLPFEISYLSSRHVEQQPTCEFLKSGDGNLPILNNELFPLSEAQAYIAWDDIPHKIAARLVWELLLKLNVSIPISLQEFLNRQNYTQEEILQIYTHICRIPHTFLTCKYWLLGLGYELPPQLTMIDSQPTNSTQSEEVVTSMDYEIQDTLQASEFVNLVTRVNPSFPVGSIPLSDYKNEWNRYKTFQNATEFPHFMNFADLAASGFVYSGRDDLVRLNHNNKKIEYEFKNDFKINRYSAFSAMEEYMIGKKQTLLKVYTKAAFLIVH